MACESGSDLRLDLLLVEDSELQIRILQRVIGDLPILRLLHVCRDGVEAIEYLTRQGEFCDASLPDAILCDINMPNKDGFEVLNEVKADSQLCTIPFIMLTTSEAEEDIVRAYREGASTFISKPIDLHGLERILEHFAHYWQASKYAAEISSRSKLDELRHLPAQLIDGFENLDLPPKSVNVLLVEDSVMQAKVIRDVIAEIPEFNFLTTLEDGEDATAYLKRVAPYEDAKRPAVIVLDLNLPKKQGLEVLQDIKADPELKDIIVVVLTVQDCPEAVIKCYNAGANTFLNKPVNVEGMRAVLHRFAGYWADEATKLPPTT